MVKIQKPFISVIIPTYNEGSNPFYKETLASLSSILDLELIIVDRSSQDQTRNDAIQHNATIIESKQNTRAGRLNQGIAVANGKIIFLHHPRSIIDIKCIDYLKTHYDYISWGGLTHAFDGCHPFYEFTSWYSNIIRGKFKQVLYLDHCIFFRRDLVSQNILRSHFIPEVDIFEDTLLSYQLQKIGDITIVPFQSKTSTIRFKKNGIFKQALLNQWLKISFLLGGSVRVMNRFYEKKLSLNSSYSSNNNSSKI
jgi:glycosyltransferase involved in cell wall biosynthesis